MPSSTPFVDPGTGSLATGRILAETIPLAKLIGSVVAVALVPFAVALLVNPVGPLDEIFVIVGQFVLAVGSGIVLMYVISRAVQISEE